MRVASFPWASSIERIVNIAAPKQMNMLVRKPAGLRLSSRSRPITPPRIAASVRRTRVLANRFVIAWGKKNKARSVMVSKSGPIVAPSIRQRLIDGGLGAQRSANCDNLLQALGRATNCSIHVITRDGDDVAGSSARLSQRGLPVRRVALAQNATKGDAGSLNCSGVGAAIH